MVTVEALSCGTLVIAFPEGAVRELVVDGRTGFLVDDESAMSAAIDRPPPYCGARLPRLGRRALRCRRGRRCLRAHLPAAGFGRFAGPPSQERLKRSYFLDDADRGVVAKRRGDHNRPGFGAADHGPLPARSSPTRRCAVGRGRVQFLGLDGMSRIPDSTVGGPTILRQRRSSGLSAWSPGYHPLRPVLPVYLDGSFRGSEA